MKDWSVDKIIAVGMMAAFIATVLAMDISAAVRGDMDIGAIAKELSIGLFSYMGRGYAASISQQSAQQQSQTSQTLGKISETASQAQKVVGAVDTIKDIVKK